MQITESLKKDNFSSMDSDYRINPNVPGKFDNKQQSSSTDESSSTLKPSASDADSSNKPIPAFTNPPPRSTSSKGNIRGNATD